ncbi:MAG: polyphosphate kinase 1, partial [Bacillota bacterium]
MDLNSEEYFLSKPLSWLEFNKRVLEEAKDKSNPLLERMKYISITMSNLDEFVMVRVARFKDKIASGYNKKDKAGYRPEEHLQLISNKIHNLVKNTYKTYQLILANLEREDIYFKDFSELNTKHINYIDNYFKEIIQPVLTPMAVDKSRPFPHLANKSLNIAVYLKSKNPKDIDLFPNKEGNELFAVVRVPSNLNRLIELPTNGKKKTFIYIEDIIKNYSEKLFSGYNIIACASFRITRNADIEIQDNNQDLLAEMEEYIKKRQWGFPVRLEIEKGMNNKLRNSLINSLKIKENDLYVIPGPIDLTPIIDLIEIEGFNNLKFDPIIPQPPGDVYNENDYFDLIENKDLLLSHPYESFDFVINFIKKSANDPKVLAIKMTLYRISGDSPIIESLAKAAENGKQVTVLVELKARFDEEKNIEWAKKLEKAGCHVVYGLIGLKVHV